MIDRFCYVYVWLELLYIFLPNKTFHHYVVIYDLTKFFFVLASISFDITITNSGFLLF